MKPGRTPYRAKSGQDTFHLYFHSEGRSLGCDDKHAAATNVYAVSGVIVIRAIVPAKQKWQRYLKPPRISAFDRLIHIRTHNFFFLLRLHRIDDPESPQAGDRPKQDGVACKLCAVTDYHTVTRFAAKGGNGPLRMGVGPVVPGRGRRYLY